MQHPGGSSLTASLLRTEIALDHAAEQQGLEVLLGRAAGQVQADGEVLERQGGQGWGCMKGCQSSGARALQQLSSSLASTSFAAPRAACNTPRPSCFASAPALRPAPFAGACTSSRACSTCTATVVTQLNLNRWRSGGFAGVWGRPATSVAPQVHQKANSHGRTCMRRAILLLHCCCPGAAGLEMHLAVAHIPACP